MKELANPPSKPVTWYVFARATGRLLGAAVAMRAYDAWEQLHTGLSFGECWVVLRSAGFRRYRTRELQRLKHELDVAVDKRDWLACTALEEEIARLETTEPDDND